MFKNIMGHPLGFRHWLSWQLRRVAYRVYHGEPLMHDIKVYGLDDGLILQLGIITDPFDGGLVTAHRADQRYRVTDGTGPMFETGREAPCGFIRISGEPST